MNTRTKIWTDNFMYVVTAIVMVFLAATSAMAEMPRQFDVVVDVTENNGEVHADWFVHGEDPMPEAKITITQDDGVFATWTEAGFEHHSLWSSQGPELDMNNAVVNFELTVPSKYEMRERFNLLPLAVNQHKAITWTCESRQIAENSWWLNCSIDQ